MEQEQISVIPADGDKKEGTSLGKFNSAEELLKAYTALESEFTKRSQKLKELESRANLQKEGENDKQTATAARAAQTIEAQESKSCMQGQTDVVEGYMRLIRENLSPRSLPKGGAIPLSPVSKPRTIKEAGEIAKKLLERM